MSRPSARCAFLMHASLAAGELRRIQLGALMPGICRRLDEDRPDIVVRVLMEKDEELLGMTRRGEVDVSFVQLPVNDADFEHVTLLEDEYVLVVRAGARKRVAPPTLDELAAMPLIGFNTGKVCQLTDYFRSNNLKPGWVVGSYDLETIHAFVAAGDGVALLPRLATLCLGPGVEVVELACGLPPRRVGLVWSKLRGESGLADAFISAATAEAARFTRSRLSVAS